MSNVPNPGIPASGDPVRIGFGGTLALRSLPTAAVSSLMRAFPLPTREGAFCESLMAGRYDPVIEQGATWSRTATYRDSSKALVNLSGYTSRMQIRRAPGATDTLVSLTDGQGITLGGAAGTIVMALTATQTAALPAGTWWYDLELVSGATVIRLLEGRVTVSPNATR